MMQSLSGEVVLLVDGYNMVGAWNRLQKIQRKHGLEAARADLVEVLTGYSAYQDYRATVVFDAQYQGGLGQTDLITQHVSVHYTNFGQTADSFIEKACATLRCSNVRASQRVIVATSDRVHRLTVVGYGAEWMSAHQLEKEVAVTTGQVTKTRYDRRQSPKRMLAHSLDTKTRDRLNELRFHGFRKPL